MSIFLVIAGCGGFLILLNTIINSIGNKGITMVTARDAQDLVKKSAVTIIDIRTPEEYRNGHLKTAKLIPVAEIRSSPGEISLRKTSPILVYCQSGHRSSAAARMLKKAGFTNIFNLQGGIMSWQAAGGTVTKK